MAYWRLGDRSGSTALDSKAGRNGTYLNAVTLGAPGAITNDQDTAVALNGSTSKISLPALPPVTDFTIEGWTYLASGATANENGNNTLYGTKGNVRLVPRPGTGTATAAYSGVWLNGTEYVLQPSSTQSNLGTWVQWALTRSGATMTLYRNGVRIGSRTDLPASATANLSGWIGAQGGSNYFLNGRADDVSIYTSALTGSAIMSHYNAAVSGPGPG